MSHIRITCRKKPVENVSGVEFYLLPTLADTMITLVDDDGKETPITGVVEAVITLTQKEAITAHLRVVDVEVDIDAQPGNLSLPK